MSGKTCHTGEYTAVTVGCNSCLKKKKNSCFELFFLFLMIDLGGLLPLLVNRFQVVRSDELRGAWCSALMRRQMQG